MKEKSLITLGPGRPSRMWEEDPGRIFSPLSWGRSGESFAHEEPLQLIRATNIKYDSLILRLANNIFDYFSV